MKNKKYEEFVKEQSKQHNLSKEEMLSAFAGHQEYLVEQIHKYSLRKALEKMIKMLNEVKKNETRTNKKNTSRNSRTMAKEKR